MRPSNIVPRLALALTWSANLSAQQSCNGSPDLCDRQFSNVSFIGTHDSAFAGTLLTDYQNVNVTAQLDVGIRFVQAQTHNNALGQLSMCHTSCFELDAGTLDTYLSTVKTWMDANPNEVVMMLLVNGDNLAIGNFSDAFSSTGLDSYAYVPTTYPVPINSWPTLSTLISSGKRLVMFIGEQRLLGLPPTLLTM